MNEYINDPELVKAFNNLRSENSKNSIRIIELEQKLGEACGEVAYKERYKEMFYQQLIRLIEAEKLIAMVEDNRKMPHQHKDYYERLCCLSERAREYFVKYKGADK